MNRTKNEEDIKRVAKAIKWARQVEALKGKRLFSKIIKEIESKLRRTKMATLTEIENLTKRYADAREQLSQRVNALEFKLELEKEFHMPGIKSALHKAKEAEARLKAAIEDSPGLFEKPRTQIFHGIKIGYQKAKGSIEWDDVAAVIERIKKFFPDKADALIRVIEQPDKKALSELSAAELKKLGVVIMEAGDEILIRPVDSDVDKIVAALLKENREDKEAA